MSTVVDLARVLCPRDLELHARVEHAVHDPASFVDAHRDSLENRGIDEPVPNLAVLALIDDLIEKGLAAELDWKEDPMEVLGRIFVLSSLPSRLRVTPVEEPRLTDDTRCHDALKLATRRSLRTASSSSSSTSRATAIRRSSSTPAYIPSSRGSPEAAT